MIDLAVTGKVIGDLTYSWCKKMSDSSTVSTSGSTLTERANGIYIIDNPNVTEDTDFRVYVTADSYKYAVGIFSPADGDIALASVCTETRLAELDAANLPTDIAAVKGDTAAILDDTGTSGVVLQPVERNYGHAGTAQAGSLSSITLAATASSISNIFIGQKISIYEGTGINQTRGVLSYNGTSKVLGVARSWEVAPDATSKYRIEYDFGPKVDSSLNVTTGTNLDKSSYVLASGNHTGAVIPTVTAITNDVGITQTGADKAWSTATRVLTAGTNIALAKGTGVTGFNDISTTDVATAVWNAATATYGTAGSYGLLVETNLDAAVSSRSTHSAADVWSVATRVLTAGTNIALAKGTGVTGFNDVSTTDVATAVWNAATATYGTAGSYGLLVETNLDAAVSSRSTHSAADVWSVATRAITDKDNFSLSSVSISTIVDEIWDESTTTHQTSGSFGYIVSQSESTQIDEIIIILNEIKGVGWTTESLKAIKEFVDDLETRLSAQRMASIDQKTAAIPPANMGRL